MNQKLPTAEHILAKVLENRFDVRVGICKFTDDVGLLEIYSEFTENTLSGDGCGYREGETRLQRNRQYILIQPNGEIKPCCGQGYFDNDRLAIGNFKRAMRDRGLKRVNDIGRAVKIANKNPIISILMAEGPHGLAKLIETREPGFLNRTWTGRCEACVHILDNYYDFLLEATDPLVRAKFWERFD